MELWLALKHPHLCQRPSKVADDAVRPAAPPQFLSVRGRGLLKQLLGQVDRTWHRATPLSLTPQTWDRRRATGEAVSSWQFSRGLSESVCDAIAQSNCRLILSRAVAGSTTLQLGKGLAGLAPPWRTPQGMVRGPVGVVKSRQRYVSISHAARPAVKAPPELLRHRDIDSS